MVKQHLFKVQSGDGHTIAISGGTQEYTAQLQKLIKQLSLIPVRDLSVPAFYQHTVGGGIAVSRCIPDPFGEKNSFLFHQLIFDSEADLRALRHIRPLSAQAFFSIATDGSLTDEALNAASEDHAAELRRCFHTLCRCFDKKEQVLAAFIGAIMFCARNPRYSLRVMLNDSPEQIAQVGHDLMELLLRIMRVDDAARISYTALESAADDDRAYTVHFMPRPSRKLPFSHWDLILDLSAGSLTLPHGVFLPSAERNAKIALALLAQDISRVDSLCGNTDTEPVYPHSHPLRLPSFKRGMSLLSHFSDWQYSLMLRRSRMNADTFRRFVLGEWKKFIDAVITAADCMDEIEFLSELHTLILQTRPTYMPEGMHPDEEILTDLKILLLDGVNWNAVDLSHPPIANLLGRVCACSMELSGEDHETSDYVLSCRILYHMLHSPIEMSDALADLATLKEYHPKRFRQVQKCLMRCVEKRLHSEFDIIDEKFVAAAILGTMQFNDENLPDMRTLNDMSMRILNEQSEHAAQRFDRIADRLRTQMHMSDAFTFRQSDLNRIILGCVALLAVIVGISVWFFFFQ